MASKTKAAKGVFITLEGSDGAGKSTQMKLLRENLVEAGYMVVSTREPGGTEQAERIREFLLSGKAEELGPEFEAALFTAARLDHVEKLIAPALAEGKVVLCDRFIDSTRVYQGVTGNVDMEFLQSLEALIKDIAWPNLTIILDLDHEEGAKRTEARRDDKTDPDRFEKEKDSIQKDRRQAFLEIAKAEPRRCKVVDAAGDEKDVQESIWKLVGPVVERCLGASRG